MKQHDDAPDYPHPNETTKTEPDKNDSQSIA
jgi:hypothetical protein